MSETKPLLGGEEGEGRKEDSKQIHLISSISIVLSMMTGVGIFIFPNLVLVSMGSPGAALVVWGCAGCVTLLAGLCYSELALAIPGSGGELVYMEKVFGRVPANLYLLTTAFVKYPSVAIILTRSSFSYLVKCVYSEANTDVAPLSLGACATGVIATAIACMMVCYSTRFSTMVINCLNTCKLVGIGLLLFSAVYYTCKNPVDSSKFSERFSFANTTTDVPTILVSLLGCMATYDGWNSLNVVAGEVHNPFSTMPVAIAVACVLAMILYLLCNVAYLSILPPDVMKTSSAVAKEVGRMALGKPGEVVITVCVIASCIATIIAIAICNSRLIQKAASQGLVPQMFRLSLKSTSTPIFAVLLHLVLCSVFAMITSVEILMTLGVLVSWFFYMLCFLSLLILRYSKGIRSQFRIPAVIPISLLLFSLVLLVSPVTTSSGYYRISFITTATLLLILLPVSYFSTLPALVDGDNFLVRTSVQLTSRLEESGIFS